MQNNLLYKKSPPFHWKASHWLFELENSNTTTHNIFNLAVWTGLEPATPCVTGMYSNQLNYQTKNVCFSRVRLSRKALQI